MEEGLCFCYFHMSHHQNVCKFFIGFTGPSFLMCFFLCYRLFFMLRRFPIESKGRRKKLHEVLRFIYLYVNNLSYIVP